MKKTSIVMVIACALTVPGAVLAQDTASEPTEDASAAQAAEAQGAEDMMQRMREMHQQRMEAMQARGGMPMMGRRGAMMSPEMMQQMDEMRRQRMEMMQSGGNAMPAMRPQGMMANQGMPGGKGMGGCMHRGPNPMMKDMMKERMAQRDEHWKAMEQRLANIEQLLRQIAEQRQGQ